MNKRQAAAVRAAQLRGEPVNALELQEAISVLASKRGNRMSLPPLRDDVQQRVNMALMFNLGRALGRPA